MLIIINPKAGGGKALQKWQKIESEVRTRLGSFNIYQLDKLSDLSAVILQWIAGGERDFVAAGGDGTVNLLVNALMEAPEDVAKKTRLGAIGLGSSNDFHKPFCNDSMIKNIPCRIDFGSVRPHDAGIIAYSMDNDIQSTKYWLINSSIGITAEANRLFNTPGSILRFLKKHAPSCAIVYAALKILVSFRAREVQISIDDDNIGNVYVDNLAVVKNPHFSGNFRYDSPHEIDSGYFNVHLVENKSLSGKILTLWKLSRPPSKNNHLTQCRHSSKLTIASTKPMALEFDGEVVTANAATFTLKHMAIQVCTN
ncbi:MAG: hypothetical protein CVT49_07760 [candidate division Zixibacteria bacterium HGW-Zixibacteria-1]|nr:MAG: hypothetical protein CVT49_07760 [candidate division Zixibacteria bacterium HGW-Zixibacteria-1]